MSTPATPEPTEIAGRYMIVQKLGAGAFGTVFKARDKLLGRMVAIKTIRMESLAAQGASITEMVDRFKREAQVSAQLKHPNIVTIYDIGESEGMSYLAMEFIDGVGLDRVIAGAGRLPVERAASLAGQVADALDFAHRHGVVHRDIKPANIMVEAGDRVKVTDFGIAKVMDSGEHLTMTGSLLGTPSYMSPEQARGAALDGRSDLFAVGCILYEMLAGKKAFRGESITGLIFKIITEEPQPIRELESSVPEELVGIIAKALAKAPEARYQSGREFCDALSATTHGGFTPTVRQSEVATGAMPAPPSQPTVGGARGTLVSAPTIAPQGATTPTILQPQAPSVPTTMLPPPATPPPFPRPPAPPAAARPSAAPPAPRSGGGGGLAVVLAIVGLVVVMVAAGGAWWMFGRPKPQPSPSPVAEASPGSGQIGGIVTPTTPPSTVAGDTRPLVTEPPTETAPPASVATQTPPPGKTTSPVQTTPTQPTTRTVDVGGGPGPWDDLPPERPDGTEAGRALAGQYSGNKSGNSYGANVRPRPRNPHDLSPAERPAVATMRWLITNEEGYYRTNNRYGNLRELAEASGHRLLDVQHTPTNFERRGYRFVWQQTDDGFTIIATPLLPSLRVFEGDETGYIRAAE